MESAHHVFPMRREHRGDFQAQASPGIFMYIVSAKIPYLPSKLSPTHSYYQHGHGDISGCRGVVDGERSSYFPHAPSSYGPPFNTCKPCIFMYVVSAKITCLPSKLSPTHSYYQHGHGDNSGCRGVVDGERSSYFPHAPSSYGLPFNTCKPRIFMYVVSAKITCLPSNLYPTHSHYQDGHDGTSICQGMPDGACNDHFLYLEGVIW